MTTNNNNQPLRTYDKKFAGMIPTIFSAKAYFAEVFGALQALDGVQNNKTAFSVKTNDVPVVIGTYNTDK
ncbi:phage capsid protein, partial [Pediococcus pentosaceus]